MLSGADIFYVLYYKLETLKSFPSTLGNMPFRHIYNFTWQKLYRTMHILHNTLTHILQKKLTWKRSVSCLNSIFESIFIFACRNCLLCRTIGIVPVSFSFQLRLSYYCEYCDLLDSLPPCTPFCCCQSFLSVSLPRPFLHNSLPPSIRVVLNNTRVMFGKLPFS